MYRVHAIASLFTVIFLSTNAFAGDEAFTGSEHKAIGDAVTIQLDSSKQSAQLFKMTLDNGAVISYGDLVAMGDFFGLPEAPISRGNTLDERVQRFIQAFDTLNREPAAVNELTQLRAAVDFEYAYLQDAISKGELPSKAYNKISNEMDRRFNCITGGGCDAKTWWLKPGRNMRLQKVNYDHFGNSAWLTYEAGHHAAMREAVLGYQTHDVSHLLRAYAMNSFACHFLTDRFATGHMRTPRGELADHVTPTDVGHLLSKFMHDEDGDGLNVHDLAGNHWRAYGDSHYFENDTAKHRQRIMRVMQISADEIFAAYQHGKMSNRSTVYNMLPIADESNGVCKNDPAAMFLWDGAHGNLLRRSDLKNMYECKWTKHWVGWATAIELSRIKGIPDITQAQIAMSEYGREAVNAGLITNKHIIAYVQNNH